MAGNPLKSIRIKRRENCFIFSYALYCHSNMILNRDIRVLKSYQFTIYQLIFCDCLIFIVDRVEMVSTIYVANPKLGSIQVFSPGPNVFFVLHRLNLVNRIFHFKMFSFMNGAQHIEGQFLIRICIRSWKRKNNEYRRAWITPLLSLSSID